MCIPKYVSKIAYKIHSNGKTKILPKTADYSCSEVRRPHNLGETFPTICIFSHCNKRGNKIHI